MPSKETFRFHQRGCLAKDLDARMSANVVVETSVEIFYRPEAPDAYWLLLAGKLFGAYRSEEEAILAIGPCLLMME